VNIARSPLPRGDNDTFLIKFTSFNEVTLYFTRPVAEGNYAVVTVRQGKKIACTGSSLKAKTGAGNKLCNARNYFSPETALCGVDNKPR
jgi:hypothetical protein